MNLAHFVITTAAAPTGTDWVAVSSIATLVIVGFTAIGLAVSIWSARQSNRASTAAIEAANSRAERDLYRDTLIKVAEWLAVEAGSQHTPDKDVSLMKARTLVSVLPVEEFELPVTRTHLGADNVPKLTDDVLAMSKDEHRIVHMRREIAGAIAQLHNRSFVLRGTSFSTGEGNAFASGGVSTFRTGSE